MLCACGLCGLCLYSPVRYSEPCHASLTRATAQSRHAALAASSASGCRTGGAVSPRKIPQPLKPFESSAAQAVQAAPAASWPLSAAMATSCSWPLQAPQPADLVLRHLARRAPRAARRAPRKVTGCSDDSRS